MGTRMQVGAEDNGGCIAHGAEMLVLGGERSIGCSPIAWLVFVRD